MYDYLSELVKKYPPPRDEIYFVHIDDLLSVLRLARKLGYKVERVRGKALWSIIGSSGLSLELYVDRTRSIQRGVILRVPRPQWPKPELRIEVEDSPLLAPSLYWRMPYTRPNKPVNPSI